MTARSGKRGELAPLALLLLVAGCLPPGAPLTPRPAPRPAATAPADLASRTVEPADYPSPTPGPEGSHAPVLPAHTRTDGWRQLTSEHVLLRTDLTAPEAERMIVELELVRALLAQALSLKLPAEEDRVQVVAFATTEELLAVTLQPEIAGREHTDGAGRQTIVLCGRLRGDDEEIAVAHEMAHALSHRVIPRQPPWFAEGLAEYLSSLGHVGPSGARAAGGLPSGWIGQLFSRSPPATLRELFAWDTRVGLDHLYASSWLLFRYLATHRSDALARFEEQLGRGEAASLAWNRAFPEWSTATPGGAEALHALLAESARDLSGVGPHLSATVAPRIEARTMTRGEVHATLLELPRVWPPGARRRQVEEALREDPAHVAALTWVARDPLRARLPLARKAVEAHPTDPEAWQLLALALPRTATAEREAALRRAVALATDRQDARLALAEELVFRDPAQAEALARQAIARVPWSADALAIHALALAGLRRCAEAVPALQRSFDVERPEPSARQAHVDQALKDRLERLCEVPAAFRAELSFRRARAASDDGEHELALRFSDEGLATNPASLAGWDQRGWVLLALSRDAEAEASFRRQLALAPRHPTAWSGLGRTLARQGKRAEAERAFRRQLEVFPDALASQVQLGALLTDLGRAQEAVAVLAHAAELYRDDASLVLELARARFAAGQDAAGLADLQRMVKGRDRPLSLNNAAFTLAVAGVHLDQAASWADEALRREVEELARAAASAPDAAEAAGGDTLLSTWDTKGWVRYREGDLAEAERWVEVALAARATAEGARHLGEILERRGERARAAAAYARALAIDADPEARARLERLVGRAQALVQIREARRAEPGRRLLGRAPAPPGTADVDRRITLVLGDGGAVLDALPASGEDIPGARAVAGLRHAVPFPAPAPARLVVPGRFRCAGGECAWYLGSEPLPADVLRSGPRPVTSASRAHATWAAERRDEPHGPAMRDAVSPPGLARVR